MIVVSAIYGGYDDPKPHPSHPNVTDWRLFTDDLRVDRDGWSVRFHPSRRRHPRMAAKRHKLSCQTSDEPVVWMDGSIALRGPQFFDVLADGLTQGDLVMFRHPDRDCIYPEADVSAQMAKYAGQDVHGQVDWYRRQGWQEHAGLWASTTFAYNPTPKIAAFLDDWWAHNVAFTYQDQLSLPVVLAAHGIVPVDIPGNLWHNRWFTLSGHRSDL